MASSPPLPEQSDEKFSLVHERQSLQLCAIHTINNLLQLRDDNRSGWMCGNRHLRERPSWTLASKAELDEIADGLTVAENQLLVQDNGKDASAEPSLYQKLSSQHRTVFLGRYSSEVMQVALQRRNVELSWFTPVADDVSCIPNVEDPSTLVIGFIVNNVSEKSIFSRIPLFGGWFGDGRHWFAISRLERGVTATATRWKVLDSLEEEADFIDTDAALLDLLTYIVSDGGSVFRATIRI